MDIDHNKNNELVKINVGGNWWNHRYYYIIQQGLLLPWIRSAVVDCMYQLSQLVCRPPQLVLSNLGTWPALKMHGCRVSAIGTAWPIMEMPQDQLKHGQIDYLRVQRLWTRSSVTQRALKRSHEESVRWEGMTRALSVLKMPVDRSWTLEVVFEVMMDSVTGSGGCKIGYFENNNL